LTSVFDDVSLNLKLMANAASSRIPLRVLCALFLLALTVAAVTRPLTRAKFNFAPDVVRLDQGITRHTYLEVGAATPEIAPVFCSVVFHGFQPMMLLEHSTVDFVSSRQFGNWPIVFSEIYRHIPPKRGDSDPSA
jgi:hypothetical protein